MPRIANQPTEETTIKTAPDAQDEKLEVVDSNLEIEREKSGIPESGATVCLACSLPHGLKFDDVPNGNGGVKTVTIPGVNDVLRGKSMGVLTDAGKAVAVTISRKDWRAIKTMHGRERAFVGRNGLPPCVIEMRNREEFRARQDEVREMRHGLEPVDPRKVGVSETTAGR